MSLPARFCLFSDQYATGDDGLKRYSVFQTQAIPLADCYAFTPVALESNALTMVTEVQEGPPAEVSEVKICGDPFEPIRRVRIWFTGQTVRTGDGQLLSVLDLEARQLLTPLCQFNYTVQDDTLHACRARQMRQSNVRIAFLYGGTAPPRPPPLIIPRLRLATTVTRTPTPFPDDVSPLEQGSPASFTSDLTVIVPGAVPAVPVPVAQSSQAQQSVPKFVAELIKASAISTGQACPITMNSFTATTPCALTPCFHLFEAQALTRWLEKNTQCPICKAPVAAAAITSL